MTRTLLVALGILVASTLGLQAADAKANWKEHCAKCHGDTGKGDTRMGKKLKAKDYTDPAVQEKMKDEEMLKAVKEGVKEDGKTRMKGYADKLSEDEMKALVQFVRELKK